MTEGARSHAAGGGLQPRITSLYGEQKPSRQRVAAESWNSLGPPGHVWLPCHRFPRKSPSCHWPWTPKSNSSEFCLTVKTVLDMPSNDFLKSLGSTQLKNRSEHSGRAHRKERHLATNTPTALQPRAWLGLGPFQSWFLREPLIFLKKILSKNSHETNKNSMRPSETSQEADGQCTVPMWAPHSRPGFEQLGGSKRSGKAIFC